MSKVKIIISDKCDSCSKVRASLPESDEIEYINIDSVKANEYNVDRVPVAFVDGQQCQLMEDDETKKIFIECPPS